MASEKNFFRQLGKGLKGMAGFGSEGYWEKVLQLITSPDAKKLANLPGDVAKGVGGGVTSIFGYLPETRKTKVLNPTPVKRSTYQTIMKDRKY